VAAKFHCETPSEEVRRCPRGSKTPFMTPPARSPTLAHAERAGRAPLRPPPARARSSVAVLRARLPVHQNGGRGAWARVMIDQRRHLTLLAVKRTYKTAAVEGPEIAV
jgi:hypothetical protein